MTLADFAFFQPQLYPLEGSLGTIQILRNQYFNLTHALYNQTDTDESNYKYKRSYFTFSNLLNENRTGFGPLQTIRLKWKAWEVGSLPKYLFIKQFNWEYHFFCISLYVFLFFSDTSEWTEVLLLRKMVKVISVHHFLSQDVTAIPGPTAGMSQPFDFG